MKTFISAKSNWLLNKRNSDDFVFVYEQENPYVMRKANYQDLEGNEQYEGFCVDMLKELADILKFTYRIKLVDDGLYGAPEPNGSWTGMVGELINRVQILHISTSINTRCA